MPTLESNEKIMAVLKNLTIFLTTKNRMYGDSALHPLSIFTTVLTADYLSKSNTETAQSLASILIRIDDKLNRIKNSSDLRKNDVVDLLGYLILLCINCDWLDFKEFLD